MRSREDDSSAGNVDLRRRRFVQAIGAGVAGSAVATALPGGIAPARSAEMSTLRWGIIGTGFIANAMAPMIGLAPAAKLAAVSSRRIETANEFGDKHGIEHRFADWSAMLSSDQVDAVYIATPTIVREEIAVAAANHGKHVLAEKPFASLPSVRTMAAACRDNGVGFMDGTHFVHAPRTFRIRERTRELVGWPWSLDSAFQFNLPDRTNIRYNAELEPMGAIGDAGWYNMRAIVEYLSPEAELSRCTTYLRRDPETGAALSGSGVMEFSDGSSSTWNCGFDSGVTVMDLRLSGAAGVIWMDDFVLARNVLPESTGGAAFEWRSDGRDAEVIVVPEARPAAAQMFEDFAGMVQDADWRERSISASERTQALLDAAWKSALAAESGDDTA